MRRTGVAGSQGQPDLPLGDVAARREQHRETTAQEGNETVAPWFDAAVSAYPKAQSLAEELGFSETHLSDMRHAKRTIPLRAILPLLKHRPSAKALLAPMTELAELAPPREKRRVTRRKAQASIARAARRLTDIWPLIRAHAALDAETSIDDIDTALDALSAEDEVAEAK